MPCVGEAAQRRDIRGRPLHQRVPRAAGVVNGRGRHRGTERALRQDVRQGRTADVRLLAVQGQLQALYGLRCRPHRRGRRVDRPDGRA